MKVKLVFVEEVLGTASANPEIHREFIASKGPEAKGIEEEVASLGAEAVMEKSTTVFPQENGKRFLWDYQLKGFIKEAVGALLPLLKKEVAVGKTKLSKFTHKRIVDNYVFVFPRKIFFAGVAGPLCTRPLRADTMQGERVALATSQTMAAGTSLEVEIKCLAPALEDVVRQCLDYGALKGLGQWRNSGKGRFTWEEIN